MPAPVFERVWLLNIESRETCPLTPADWHIFEYAWSPDGQKLVVLASSHPNPAEGWYSAQLYSVDLADGTPHPLCVMPHQIGRPTWSPDFAVDCLRHRDYER